MPKKVATLKLNNASPPKKIMKLVGQAVKEWNMIEDVKLLDFQTSYINVLAHKDKLSWKIVHKFNFLTLTD
jgi:hypothetical protein